MAAEEVLHMMLRRRYNLRPRLTCRKVEQRCTTIVSSYSAPPKRKQRLRHTLHPHNPKLSIPYLSLDIIFNILVYLPADILYNVVRYVCREWYNIISSPEFIDAHLLKRERGLLIKQICTYCNHYVEETVKKNDDDTLLQVVEIGYTSDMAYGMSTSCNGLVLMSTLKKRYVANFVTKEVVTLPPPGGRSDIEFPTIGYIPRSKKYKLVEFYIKDQLAVECGILTLGVDREWRSLFQVYQNMEIENFGGIDFIYGDIIVSAEGILHLIHPYVPLVFNLDLETETFYTRAIPKRYEKYRTTYMKNGRSLCFMDYLGKFSWELWLLKDAETGEWTKLATIDLGRQEQMLRRALCPTGFVLVPVGFLKDGEIVVFYVVHENGHRKWSGHHNTHPSRNCITYNVKTGGGISSFHLDKGSTIQMDRTWRYIPHVKSLVSLKFGAS